MDLNPYISPSQTAEKPAPLFISTTSLFHKQKMLNSYGFIWTDASLGTNISPLNGNTLVPKLYWLLGRKSKLDLNN
jgi:hypothetical protein